VVDLAITGDIRADAALGNYLVQFSDSTFIDLFEQEQSGTIYPFLASGEYPVWSAEVSLTAASLESSFSNYPNPFVPSRGEVTTLAYVLSEDAVLDIEVYTTTGVAVTDLARDQFRTAGAHSDITWVGTNDAGRNVAPGAYLCRVTARYASGRVETFTRKIAVVR
jgi:hypothetical protein